MTARAVRLSRRAHAAFQDIAVWTESGFGANRAIRNLGDIPEQIQVIAEGTAVPQACGAAG